MDIYYAVGSGLGHANRARLFIEKLQLSNILVIVNSQYAKKLLEPIPHKIIPISCFSKLETARHEAQKIIRQHKPEKVYLDTFPGGIVGEWCGIGAETIHFYLVSRILKVEIYKKILPDLRLPTFKKIFISEKISDAQYQYLKCISVENSLIDISLTHGLTSKNKATQIRLDIQQPFWLIIHSGNIEECLTLYQHALDLAKLHNKIVEICFVHPQPKSLSRYVEGKVFQDWHLKDFVVQAEKIFTACGYNLMHELQEFRDKQVFIPFFRKYDDQFLRAKYFRA